MVEKVYYDFHCFNRNLIQAYACYDLFRVCTRLLYFVSTSVYSLKLDLNLPSIEI